MTKNRLKNGSLNRVLLNFWYSYGIFWMPKGESSHPGSSEYVWQRGAEGVSGRGTGGRSLPYFQKKRSVFAVSQKNSTPRIFGIELVHANHFYFFVTPHIFANGPHFVALTRLWRLKQGQFFFLDC